MPHPFAVRDAIIEDAAAIAPLLGELGYPADPQSVRQRLARLLPREDTRVFLAERHAEILGVIGVHRMPVVTAMNDVAMILALVVTEGARGQGVGRRLVERAEDEARVWRCGQIIVTSANRRADAHEFYKRMGYDQNGLRFAKKVGL